MSLCTAGKAERGRAGRPAAPEAHEEAVKRVIGVMRRQVGEPLSLGQMSDMASLSPFHFHRLFRRLTGIPPSQFLYALRLDTARKLLVSTSATILDICYQVGYNSVGTFSRRFRDLLGASPSQIRSLVSAYGEDDLPQVIPDSPAAPRSSSRVTGVITAPAGFHGFAFIGLFPDPIPQKKPVACTILKGGGTYSIDVAKDGKYYLFALGLSGEAGVREYLHYERALRAGGQSIHVLNGTVQGEPDLILRPPVSVDPPILLCLPLLVQYAASRKMVAVHPGTVPVPWESKYGGDESKSDGI